MLLAEPFFLHLESFQTLILLLQHLQAVQRHSLPRLHETGSPFLPLHPRLSTSMTGPSSPRSSTPALSFPTAMPAYLPEPTTATGDNVFSFKTAAPVTSFDFDVNTNAGAVKSSDHTDGSKGRPVHGLLGGHGELEQPTHVSRKEVAEQDFPFATKDTVIISLMPRAQPPHTTHAGAASLGIALSGQHIQNIDDLGVPPFQFPTVINVGDFCC